MQSDIMSVFFNSWVIHIFFTMAVFVLKYYVLAFFFFLQENFVYNLYTQGTQFSDQVAEAVPLQINIWCRH